ncbi:MAG: C39 family peptidase [Parcubacteria group bacterium]|jgi:hypothetical protein
MNRYNRKIILFFAIAAGIVFATHAILRSPGLKDSAFPKDTAKISKQGQSKTNTESPAENIPEPVEEKSAPREEEAVNIPEKYLLDMPFYSQAPLSKWDAFHEEMCEEASLLNAGLYLENKELTKGQFETELQKIQKIEKNEVGEWKSTTISQTKEWADVYFKGKIKSKIIENPTIEDIESEIAAGLPAGEVGNPVVVPLAGRDIGNPNFTPPGPIYHMLVIKGYDAQNFITNDVGTRKGDSYTYKKEVIMKNIHDWNANDIHAGASRILVLYR